MRKVLLLLAGVAVLAVPAVSIAGGGSSSTESVHPNKSETPETKKDKSSPANVCRSKTLDAASNAFGKCVSMLAKHQGKSAATQGAKGDGKDSSESDAKDSAERDGKSSASPALTCKAMQANDPTRFEQTYGTRPNAFGKCVSGHANRSQG